MAVAGARLREAQEVVVREARLVARDPGVVLGAQRGDWAVLAREISPRLVSLTSESLADLVLVTDSAGQPLVQVPALPAAPIPELLRQVEPGALLRVIGGHAHVIGVAPILAPDGQRVGTTAVARRFDRLAPPPGLSEGPALVAVAGDVLVGATRLALPAQGWAHAVAAGARALGEETWTVRRVPGADSVLALVPARAYDARRRQVVTWATGSLLLAGLVSLAAAFVAGARPRRAAPPPAPAAPPAPAPRTPLAAFLAITEKILVASGWDSREVFGAVAEAATGLLEARSAQVWVADVESRVLRVQAIAGIGGEPERLVVERIEIPFGQGVIGTIYQSGAAEYLADVQEDARWLHPQFARDAGFRAFSGVPLVVADRVAGVLAILFAERRQFGPEDKEVMNLLADQAALAIHNARLLGEERMRREQLAALLEINTKIGAPDSADELGSAVAEEAARLLDVDNAGLRLVEGTDLVLAGVAGAARETMLRPRLAVGESLSGRVIAEARSLILDLDGVSDAVPEHREADARLGYRWFLGVPLTVGRRTIGVLVFRSRRPFEPHRRALAEAFAGQAAIALEHARLYREVRRQAERTEALADVERLLSETLDPDMVARRIAESLRGLLGVASSMVYRVDDSTGVLTTIAVSGGLPHAGERPFRLASGSGASGLALRERRPVVTPDLLADPRIDLSPQARRQVERLGYRAAMAVPLIVRDRPIGTLSVGDHPGRRFDDSDIRLAQAFADQAARALENAQLHEESERGRREAEELARLARTLTETLDVASVGERIAASVLTLFGAHASSLRTLEPDGSLRALVFGGESRIHFQRDTVLPPGIGLAGRAVVEGRAAWTTDILQDDSVSLTPELRRDIEASGNRAFLSVLLRVKGQVFGVLTIAYRAGREFSGREIALLQAFADQAALALDNAKLHAETDRRRREAEVVAELTESLNTSLDLGTVLQRVVEGARDLCGSDVARVALRDGEDETLVFRHWVGARYQGYPALRIARGVGVTGLVLETGRAFRTDDWSADRRIVKTNGAVVTQEGIVTELAVPIRIGERVEGVLCVDNRSPRPFTDLDEAMLQRLADHAGTAIQNARLYRQARDHGERVRALDEVNRLVSSSLDVEEVLHNLAAALARFFDSPYVAVWVHDAQTGRIRRSLTLGPLELDTALPREFGPGEGAPSWVVTHRQPIIWADITSDPRMVGVGPMIARGLRYLLIYPIAIGDRVLGAVAMCRNAPPPVSAESGTILASLASQAAVALDHARLFGETTQRLEQTRALLEVAEILNSTLDTTQLLKRVAIKIAQVCRVDRCSLERWDGDQVTPLMSQFADGHADAGMWSAFRLPSGAPHEVPAQARVIETRAPVVIADATRTDLIPREWVEAFGHKSCLLVPMLRQEDVIGVLTLDYVHEVNAFERWQVDLAQAIAGQLALSLENTRLFAESQERLREATTLLAVGRALSEPASLPEQLRRVARVMNRAFGADMVGVYGLDEAGDRLVPIAGYRVLEHLREVFRAHPIDPARQPRLSEAWRSGRAAWSGDPQHDDGFDREWAALLPPHSVLLAPTRAHQENVGALFLVWWHTGRAFSEAEQRLIEGVAAQVGLALENAELVRQREIRLQETETLLSVSRALSSTLDLDSLLRHFLRQVAGAVGADSVGVFMLEEDGHTLAPRAGFRVPIARLDGLRRMRLSTADHGLYTEAARSRRPVFVSDVDGDPRVPEELRRLLPHRSQIFVPILAKDRLIGGFMAIWTDRTREFPAGELALMEAIANQAGVAVENARLFEENRRQVEELSVLHELSRAVTGQVDREALLATLRALVPRVLDARKMTVLLLHPEADQVEMVLHIADGQDRPVPPPYPASHGLASRVIATGRPVRTDDHAAECRRLGVVVPPVSALRYWLGLPMRTGDETLGVLALSRDDRPFTASDERLGLNVADLAALALRSARLFEERTRAYGELAAAQDHLVRTEKLRALGEMASGVAHDFNNLLAAILGRAQLLLRRVGDPTTRQWVQVIERSALDGAQTVKRLQEFARVRRDVPFVAVDLNEVVRDALDITEARWREEAFRRGVELQVRTMLAPVPPIDGDAAELREAMTNLVLNAVDAMPAGGTLTLQSALVDGAVEVIVSDTGLGMPESVRARIFDPFFTTKGPQGTGLGLSMTYGIVSRHRGSITVESAEGRGSTFRLRFPPGAHEAPPRVEPPAPPVEVASRLRCLVVDDEEAVATVIGDVLQAVGHDAVVVTDGTTAIERFRAERFDAVFTDLAMPAVSGWQVAHAVKATAPEVPVFLVTGFGVELSPAEREAHSVEAIFPKPLRIEDIMEALARVPRRQDPNPRSEDS